MPQPNKARQNVIVNAGRNSAAFSHDAGPISKLCRLNLPVVFGFSGGYARVMFN
jgi:hypothetical protein